MTIAMVMFKATKSASLSKNDMKKCNPITLNYDQIPEEPKNANPFPVFFMQLGSCKTEKCNGIFFESDLKGINPDEIEGKI